jgi:protoporphyrinogen/coproporphyrinogen III oxidase
MNSPEGSPAFQPASRARVAIVGGGISGLAVAYELTRGGAEFVLFEASGRLGGIVETAHAEGFVIECGPDAWVTEKPWAAELARELGLEDQIVSSNDERRRTYLVKEAAGSPFLAPVPDGMRLMVPTRWEPILESPLFSEEARRAYLREPARAHELKAASVNRGDESVAEFVRRHFGDEVTRTIAAPLLAGVFGGDVESLSVRAVMPTFVAMEAEHGSLITALEQRAAKAKVPQPIFSSLATGLGTFIDRLAGRLPEGSVRLHQAVNSVDWDGEFWRVNTAEGKQAFHSVVLATPAHVTARLLAPLGGSGPRMASLLPQEASSAIVVALAFDPTRAAQMRIPRGFGFLVPPTGAGADGPMGFHGLLACTFVDQKFANRAPSGAVLLRAFFGGSAADALSRESDETLTQLARRQLARILSPQSEEAFPEPVYALVRRWPLSLPQYAVGHLERLAELETLCKSWRGLYLAGNAYHGVGLPDLIRDGRRTARVLLETADGAVPASEC